MPDRLVHDTANKQRAVHQSVIEEKLASAVYLHYSPPVRLFSTKRPFAPPLPPKLSTHTPEDRKSPHPPPVRSSPRAIKVLQME